MEMNYKELQTGIVQTPQNELTRNPVHAPYTP